VASLSYIRGVFDSSFFIVEEKMKISVYGSSGFIGGTFCNLFSEDVIKIPRDQRKPESKNILYLISTISNYNVFDNLNLDVDTNLTVLLDTLQYCKDNDLIFNYVSTGFVYGPDIVYAKEDDPCDPRGFYSITKRTAEQLLISFCNTFDVKYRIMRIANVYGQDKTVSSKKNVLGFLIRLMKENKPITLYDDGMQLRDYMHVTDICKALKLVIDDGEINSIYNIASGNALPFREIIETVKKILRSESELISVETPKFNKIAQAKNFALNADKLKSLGFKPEIDLYSGLQSICF
jgi:nucleoside-diphosphate-sugar epimerase